MRAHAHHQHPFAAPRNPVDVTAQFFNDLSLIDQFTGLMLDEGGYDGLVGFWSLDSAAFEFSFVMSDAVSAVSFNSLGGELTAGAYDGSLVTWQLTDGVPAGETRQEVSDVGVSSLVYSPVDQKLAVGLESGEILLRDAEGGFERIPGHPVHQHPVSSLAFGPGGRYPASGSSKLEVWNLATSRLEFTLPVPGRRGEIAGIAFAAEARSLAVARRDTVWIVPLEIDAWIALACQRANRNLTEVEWKSFMGDQPWHQTCPDRPEVDGPTVDRRTPI